MRPTATSSSLHVAAHAPIVAGRLSSAMRGIIEIGLKAQAISHDPSLSISDKMTLLKQLAPLAKQAVDRAESMAEADQKADLIHSAKLPSDQIPVKTRDVAQPTNSAESIAAPDGSSPTQASPEPEPMLVYAAPGDKAGDTGTEQAKGQVVDQYV